LNRTLQGEIEEAAGPTRLTVLFRVRDVLGASVLLIGALPFLVAGAVAVWITSGRPVFFVHVRMGKGGRPFRCWKLRTMSVNAQERLERDEALRLLHANEGFKLPALLDPRITTVGKWLRRTYIDETPQLLNVLMGSMSLVGPRPVVAEELLLYGENADELLTVKPGIVGAWASLGRRRPQYPERAWIELDYVRNRAFLRDIVVLLRTIPVVLRGQE
jgi:lipopolysaccharide/colanic/teichoic acid biosynthesis glycosyltransferase